MQPDYEDDFDEVAEEDVEADEDSENDQNPDSSFSEDDGEVPATPTNLGATMSNSKAVVMKAMDLMEIMEAMDAENQLVGIPSPSKLESHAKQIHNDRTVDAHSARVRASTSRKFVDFSSAQKKEVNHKVSKKTRKRGQVRKYTIGIMMYMYKYALYVQFHVIEF